jgi:multiple sugar transport system permease protein
MFVSTVTMVITTVLAFLFAYGLTRTTMPGKGFFYTVSTLPLIAPILVLVFLRDLVVGLQLTFVPALIVTEGGPPPYATTYVSLFAYRNAFEYLRYGYAAAAVVVLFVLTALVVAVQLGLLRRWRRRWAL